MTERLLERQHGNIWQQGASSGRKPAKLSSHLPELSGNLKESGHSGSRAFRFRLCLYRSGRGEEGANLEEAPPGEVVLEGHF